MHKCNVAGVYNYATLYILPDNPTQSLVNSQRKSMSVKSEVHERYRKAAARLSTKEKRITIAELVEFLGKYLPDIKMEEVKGS